MASKINTKFVLIIVLALGFAGAILGGLWFLQYRGDAGRNIRQGDTALAVGDLKKARDYYGRAVHKQPGNMAYLDKFEGVIRQMKPQTTDEAMNLYRDLLGVFQRRVVQRPSDTDAHLALLHELHAAARQGGSTAFWEMLGTAANEMYERLDETDPKRVLGKVYASLAMFNQTNTKELVDLNQAVSDMQSVIRSAPNEDLAWSTLITGQRAVADKMRSEGKTQTAVLEQRDHIDQTVQKAAEAAPNGIETTAQVLWHLAAKRNADPASTTPDQVKAMADRLASLISDDLDTAVLSEVADLLSRIREEPHYNMVPRTIELLKSWLAKHPQGIDRRLSLAGLQYLDNKLDDAVANADMVLSSEIIPASYMGQLQFELRKRAAVLLVDIRQRQWAQPPDEGRAQRMAAMEAARDKLASLVINPANDLFVLRADGKIAQSKGEYRKAVACFERVIKESPGVDAELLLYAYDGLSRIGEIGQAYERLVLAWKLQPNNPMLVKEKARCETRMGRLDDALATIKTMPAQVQEEQEVKDLVAAIHNSKSGLPAVSEDPVARGLNEAIAALGRNDIPAAREALVAVHKANPQHIGALQTLIQVEFRDGKTDAAREYLNTALAIQKDSPALKQWDAMLKYDDPVERLLKYHEQNQPDEARRAIVLAVDFHGLARQQQAQSDSLKDTDAAGSTKAAEVARRARDEETKWLALAKQKSPDSPQLIEFEFNRAIMAKDFVAAEEVAARAKAANTDQADGSLFKGRLEFERGNFLEAIRNLESATDRLSYSSSAWRTLAITYQAQGNWEQAQRAYERAYQCNPNDLETAKRYVAVLMRKGDQVRALDIIHRVRPLVPRDLLVREAWLQLEADVGDKPTAFMERMKIYKESPEDRANAEAYARLLGEITPSPGTITDEDGKPLYTNTRWDRMTVDEKQAAAKKARDGWLAKADNILSVLGKDCKNVSDELKLAVLKARLAKSRDDVQAGEEVLRVFIEAHKGNLTVDMLLELGKYQIDSNHFAEAIGNFLEARKYQDPKNLEADRALGKLYLRLNMFDKAVAQLQMVDDSNPSPDLQQQIVECYIRLRNFDEAEKRLKALTAESTDSVSTMLMASIAEGRANDLLAKGDSTGAERKFAEQRELLAQAEAQDVNNPIPLTLLAQSFFSEYGRTGKASLLEDALLALERAEKRAPGDVQSSMMRIEVFKVKNDFAAAIAELRRVLALQPDNPAARRQLMQMYLDTGDANAAIETIQEAVDNNPTLAYWWETLGDLHHAVRQDPVHAYQCYAKAYELVSTAEMLAKLIDCGLGVPKPDYTLALSELSKRTQEMNTTPILRLLYARTLNATNKRTEALEQYRQAYQQYRDLITSGKKQPEDINDWFGFMRHFFDLKKEMQDVDEFVGALITSPDSFELRILARMWAGVGGPGMNRAIELQNKSIEGCPPTRSAMKSQLQLDLGNYLMFTKQGDAAVRAWEEATRIDPDNVDAANNLAFYLADTMNDAKRALTYAERLPNLAPNNASVLDTVGWVYFKAGHDDKALEFLRRSLVLDDKSAATHVHLAYVLFKTGALAEARDHVRKAKELNPDPDTQEKIRQLEESAAAEKSG